MLSHPGTRVPLSHSLGVVECNGTVEHLALFICVIISTQSAGNESPLALRVALTALHVQPGEKLKAGPGGVSPVPSRGAHR